MLYNNAFQLMRTDRFHYAKSGTPPREHLALFLLSVVIHNQGVCGLTNRVPLSLFAGDVNDKI